MNDPSLRLTIIVPNKHRAQSLTCLLESIGRLRCLEKLHAEVIVADNGSDDDTFGSVDSAGKCFPTTLRVLKVTRPGKSAAVNDALKAATGDVVVYLDNDVVVDKNRLAAIDDFFPQRRIPGRPGDHSDCRRRRKTTRKS